jgi:hypothetical protein
MEFASVTVTGSPGLAFRIGSRVTVCPSAENKNSPRRDPAPRLKAWNDLTLMESGSTGRSKVTLIDPLVDASRTARSGEVVTTESVPPVAAKDVEAGMTARQAMRTGTSDRTRDSKEQRSLKDIGHSPSGDRHVSGSMVSLIPSGSVGFLGIGIPWAQQG